MAMDIKSKITAGGGSPVESTGKRATKRLYTILSSILSPVVAILMAFLIASFLISYAGANPLLAFASMFRGAFGTVRAFTETLVIATPLLLAGLGLLIAYRTGMISIGAQGQMIIGGLFAALPGIYLPGLPGYLLIPLMMLAGMLGGALLAVIPGYLKARFGISEVINTLMLNYIAFFTTAYLLDGPLREPPGYFPQSAQIAAQAHLPTLITGTRLHLGFVFALVAVVIVYLLLWRSPLGYEMRAAGLNRDAAEYAGIPVRRRMILAFALSGAFAGLAGMVQVAGIQFRLISGFTSNYGFDALAVALLGRLHPVGVMIASLFFGALRTGAGTMQRTVQIPASMIFFLQGLVILFVLSESFFRLLLTERYGKTMTGQAKQTIAARLKKHFLGAGLPGNGSKEQKP
jgi:simple sugar transport system permease protein